jgi:amidase
MYRDPDLADIKAKAASLGARLSDFDAEVLRNYLVESLRGMDTFVQDPDGIVEPPRYPGTRGFGYRPGTREDPYRAWMWKCEISGTQEGPLAGKRISFKDHIAVAGLPQSFGAFALDGFVQDFDATVVSRCLAAGGTVVGKNVMDGMAGGFGFGGGLGDYGRPLNPHKPEYLSGGSSSGSAVAVVRGETDVSFGGDQGGSIRVPAAWSGCIGLKPTFGLVSHFGIAFGSDFSIDHVGPMTRTVQDAALALDATAGYDYLDPRQNKSVPERYDSMAGINRGVDGLRLGILAEGFQGATPEVDDAVNTAIAVLQSAGAVVSKISVPEHRMMSRASLALGAEGSLALRQVGYFGAWNRTYYPEATIEAIMRVCQNQGFALDPWKLGLELLGMYSRQFYAGRAYARAQNVRGAYIAAYDAKLNDVDALVMPTVPMQAPVYDEPASLSDAMQATFSMVPAIVQNTAPFDLTGHPALSIPVEKKNGLPVGMQIVSRYFSDDLVLRIGKAYTEAVPHHEYIAIGS